MLENIPTFNQNLSQLYSLKQQLLRLNYIYSKETINFQQMQELEQLRKQIFHSQKKLQYFHKQLEKNEKNYKQTIDQLENEKEQLLNINQCLVKSNENFNLRLKESELQNQMLTQNLERQREDKKQIQIKYNKEIQNLKLMHAQQLYIIRKKEKRQ